MKCAWPTMTLASAGFAISTILSCIVLAPCDYCADDAFVDVAPGSEYPAMEACGWRADPSHEFRDAAAVVFLPALVARAANVSEERQRRAFRFCCRRRRAQLARRPDARARDRQPCRDRHLRARTDRRNLPRPEDSARPRRGPRRSSPQHAWRAARAVLSLRSADSPAAVYRALDAHGAAPRRRQAENLRAHVDA